MIEVENKPKTVVPTLGPDGHDMLTMAPVRISLTLGEAKELAKKLRAATAAKEENRMSHRLRNRKRNKHVVSYYWRGDVEDTERWAFPTQEAAWAHVLGEVRRRIKAFEPKETVGDHGKTIVDWDKFKSDLFSKGKAEVVYCQCSAWWDNWSYREED